MESYWNNQTIMMEARDLQGLLNKDGMKMEFFHVVLGENRLNNIQLSQQENIYPIQDFLNTAWKGEWMNEQMNEQMNKQMSEWLSAWLSEWVSWVSKWEEEPASLLVKCSQHVTQERL